MENRRTVVLYAALVFCFFGVMCRLFGIASNKSYAGHAAAQTITTLRLGSERGDFYDCDGRRITGAGQDHYALCVPGEQSYASLFDYTSAAQQAQLYKKRNSAAPFLIRVNCDLSDCGITTYTQSRRYADCPACVHLIGCCGSDGAGQAGLEAAFDDVLAGSGRPSTVQCVTNAQGRLMEDTRPVLHTADDGCADVQLTISLPMQRACEAIASRTMTTGCILVLDTATAEVRASVSMPQYDPENVAKSIAADDGSLLNRALCAYNVGSVFKPVLAAAALEEKLSWFTADCDGYVNVNDHIYRCAGGVPHGETDLRRALEKSCNCYFIRLGAALGPKRLHDYAEKFGFGQPIYVAGGLKAAAGSLPNADTLENLGQQANFCFGQGLLLATPVHLAAMMNAIAEDGIWRAPTFVKRVFDADTDKTITDYSGTGIGAGVQRTVLTAAHAKLLRSMLASVVSDGIGMQAQPTFALGAGKTGTAQTGRFDENGDEYKDLWFAGFYPAEEPKYTVVVLQDDQTAAALSSAAIYAKVCDALYLLDEELQGRMQGREE